MRRILVSEFVTLDGVIEAPGHEEHRDGRNAWALSLTSEDMLAHAAQQLLEVDALLLGRVTYQYWAAFWPLATDVFLGERINALPKYVVSNTLTDLSWNNSTLISGDVPARSRSSRRARAGTSSSGSADLFDLLLKHNLIDELRYMLYPVVLGSGNTCSEINWTPPTSGSSEHGRSIRASCCFAISRRATRLRASTRRPTCGRINRSSRCRPRRMRTASSPRSFSPTSSIRQAAQPLWEIAAGVNCSIATIASRTRRSTASAGGSSRARATASSATFDTPTRAIQCAVEIVDGLAESEIRIRAGIHTGEIQLLGPDVGGIMHIASRVMGEARAGQVVVTRTVRDLATGTDLMFASLGSVNLRGVPGEWEPFRVSIGGRR